MKLLGQIARNSKNGKPSKHTETQEHCLHLTLEILISLVFLLDIKDLNKREKIESGIWPTKNIKYKHSCKI